MTLFVENPVAASSLARWLNASMKPQTFDESVVFLRHPLQRFWSAVKKDYEALDVKESVQKVLSKLEGSSFSHYVPQVKNIEGKRVTKVIKMDEAFTDNVRQAITDNKVQWIEGFDLESVLAKPVNATPSNKISDALSYIRENTGIMAQLNTYYADDFAWWDNPNSKLGG
jgi:hypothetical protein